MKNKVLLICGSLMLLIFLVFGTYYWYLYFLGINNVEIYEVNLNKAKMLYDNGDKREEVKHIAALEMTVKEIEENKGDDRFMESLAVRLGRLNPGGISFVTPEEDDKMMINTMKKMARERGLKEGLKEGLKKGRKEGQKIGHKDGQ